MTMPLVLDAAGRRRSPAAMSDYHAWRPPRSKDIRYSADPPSVDEIVAVMPTRRRPPRMAAAAMVVVLWRAGLRL